MTPRMSTEYYKSLFATPKVAEYPFLGNPMATADVRRIWASLWQELRAKAAYLATPSSKPPARSNATGKKTAAAAAADAAELQAKRVADALSMLAGTAEPDEDMLQPLMTAVHEHCLSALPAGDLVVRDTSTRLGPLSPNHKFDHVFVQKNCVSAQPTCRVEWPYVVSVEQIKAIPKDGASEKWTKGLLQLAQDFEQILAQQPARRRVTGHITSGVAFQFWWADGAADNLRSSQKFDFLRDQKEPTAGFELYLRMLSASPTALGLTDTTLPALSDELYQMLKWKRADCVEAVLRRGSPDKAIVFTVQPNSGECAVVKAYPHRPSFEAESAALRACANADSVRLFVPRLVSTSKSDAKEMSVVVQPRCVTTLYDAEFTLPRFVAAVRAAMAVLSYFHDTRRCVHGDVTPSNALVPSEDADEVLINDFGGSVGIGKIPLCYTPVFAAFDFAPTSASSTDSSVKSAAVQDWQGLFFTLLHYTYADPAHDSRHLPWAHVTDAASMWLDKSMLCHQRAPLLLSHVQPLVRGVMTAMHAALFQSKMPVESVRDVINSFLKTHTLTDAKTAPAATTTQTAATAAATTAATASASATASVPAGIAPSAAASDVKASASVIAPDPIVYLARSRYHLNSNAHGYTSLRSIRLSEVLAAPASSRASLCPKCAKQQD